MRYCKKEDEKDEEEKVGGKNLVQVDTGKTWLGGVSAGLNNHQAVDNVRLADYLRLSMKSISEVEQRV